MEPAVFAAVTRLAAELASNDGDVRATPSLVSLARNVCTATEGGSRDTHITFGTEQRDESDSEMLLAVIMPGSYGIEVGAGNAEFYVEGVTFVPRLGTVSYRGRYGAGRIVAGQAIMIRHDALMPVSGESTMGWYNLDTGEVTSAE
jgi:hypothetical protein